MHKLASLVRFPLNYTALFLFIFGISLMGIGFLIFLLNQPHSSEEAFLAELVLGIIFITSSALIQLLKHSRFSVLGKIVIALVMSTLIVGITLPFLFGGFRSNILNRQIREASLGCGEGADCVYLSGDIVCVFDCGPRLVRKEKYDQLLFLIRATSWMKDDMCAALCPASPPLLLPIQN